MPRWALVGRSSDAVSVPVSWKRGDLQVKIALICRFLASIAQRFNCAPCWHQAHSCVIFSGSKVRRSLKSCVLSWARERCGKLRLWLSSPKIIISNTTLKGVVSWLEGGSILGSQGSPYLEKRLHRPPPQWRRP